MKTIAVLASLDTKGPEAQFLREQIGACGQRALLIDTGVVGTPAVEADITRQQVFDAGGTSLEHILEHPTQDESHQFIIPGVSRLLLERLARDEVHAVIGLGGTQGTSVCCRVMQSLPYGLPKIMVSTVASGNVASFVDIKDITMMFSVGDILGLNPVLCKILANAAGAACGMANVGFKIEQRVGDKPLIGMTNIGLATRGTMRALELFRERGYEVIVFHAVGSGGRAMEQMMKDGVIGAVLDYALVEITADLHGGLNAAGPERLQTAGKLGLPQVICTGGVEHCGFLLPKPHEAPKEHLHRKHYFHSPVIFVCRLDREEMVAVAKEIAQRLQCTEGDAVLLVPAKGFSRACYEGGPLHDPEGDQAFITTLVEHVPKNIRVEVLPCQIEDESFVQLAVDNLIALIEKQQAA